MQLKTGTLLQSGKYRIERVLGQGGFGITYLAEHTILETKVAIKEFFPNNFCSRDETSSNINSLDNNKVLIEKLMAKFIKEAKNVAKFHHPNIVRVSDIFEENNSAYYVMDFIEGDSLGEIIRANGKLSEGQAADILHKICEALVYIHSSNLNHLDIKPSNIMIQRNNGIPVLIDFGMAKQYDDLGDQTSTTPVGVSHGFAPPEQYKAGGVSSFSPQTDIYSLGATLYTMISGKNPPESLSLLENELTFDASFSKEMITVISKAMSVVKSKRYATVADFLTDLDKGSIRETSGATTILIDNSLVTDVISKKDDSVEIIDEKKAKIFRIDDVEFKMIKVEGGVLHQTRQGFWGRTSYRVDVDSFMIGETQVTQELWEKVMGENPSEFKGKENPVEYVTYMDCYAFIEKLNKLTGYNFHFPTPYEWEFAANGGNFSKNFIYSGSDILEEVGWYNNNSNKTTHPVKLKRPNELGIYDMSGNVWEMTSEVDKALNRVCKGGSWYNYSNCAKIEMIKKMNTHIPGNDLGLRLAL